MSITNLAPNEVFVFGSNEAGRHGKGGALTARLRFGAVYGQGYGLQGRSFAIPTKDRSIKTLPLDTIGRYVADFIEFARLHPNLRFLVTEIGCGLAGYKPSQIGPLFKGVPENVILPLSFRSQ